MTVIKSAINTRSAEFQANAAALGKTVADLRDKAAQVSLGGGESARAKHTARGKLLPRDRVGQVTDIDGIPIELIDTGGFMPQALGLTTTVDATNRLETAVVAGGTAPGEPDPIHRQAWAAALSAARQADLTLAIVDASRPDPQDLSLLADQLAGLRPVVVANKIDLAGGGPASGGHADDDRAGGGAVEEMELPIFGRPALAVSAQTGQNVEELRRLIVARLFPETPAPDQPVLFTRRQQALVEALLDAGDADIAAAAASDRRRLVEKLFFSLD